MVIKAVVFTLNWVEKSEWVGKINKKRIKKCKFEEYQSKIDRKKLL